MGVLLKVQTWVQPLIKGLIVLMSSMKLIDKIQCPLKRKKAARGAGNTTRFIRGTLPKKEVV